MIPWTRLTALYERELAKLMRGSASTLTALQNLISNPQFERRANRIAESMVARVEVSNRLGWQRAAARSTRSREIYEALRQELADTPVGRTVRLLVRRNAEEIRSVPGEVARDLVRFISRQQQAGRRASEIEAEVRAKAPQLTASRIRLISRTEIGKAESAVTQARSEQLGADWYQWQTSEDSRVRRSHRLMDQVLVRWSDAPSPEALARESSKLGRYHAGRAPNCRCLSLVLISLDEAQWPANVYADGRITRMTRAQFSKLYVEKIAA